MPSLEYTQTKGLVQKKSDTDEIVLLGQLSGHREHLVTITGDTALSAQDSGKTFLLADADTTISLPTVLPKGIRFKFIALEDLTNDVEILQLNNTEDFEGVILDGAGTSAAPVNTDVLVRFANGTAVAGDFFECVSTGLKWNVRGSSRAAGGIVFA